MTRVLVCGGRFYADKQHMADVMDSWAMTVDIEAVIEGEADGADTLAKIWAKSRGIPVDPYPADWARFGRAAGMRRNKRMLRLGLPDIVVAFPGDVGTANMMGLARRAGAPVYEVAERTPCPA